MKFIDSFLQRLSLDTLHQLREIQKEWKISEEDFVDRLDGWFSNFENKDKELAFKVIKNIRYYSIDKFSKRLSLLYQPISQYLSEFDKLPSDLIIILPEKRGDSADKHAYEITKNWKIPQQNVYSIENVSENNITKETILVAFNDTHGTGNQFMYDIWIKLKSLKETLGEIPTLFIVAITISEKALNYFKFNFDKEKVIIVPDVPEPSAVELFSAKEYSRLEELCSRVYPPHAMGYGNTGLLTAYYFQCPNNTLPIIWADGTNNLISGKAYPWTPLFAYKPKSNKNKLKILSNSKESKLFTNKTDLKFSKSDLNLINDTLFRWGCDISNLNEHINLLKWFNNFSLDDKDLALKIFCNTDFMNIVRVRKLIKELGNNVMKDIRSNGGDKSDILLVLTGYEKASVYHHVFDFLKIWNLKISQAIILEDLVKHEYESLNKNLIFFYHTRAGNGQHFIETIWGKVKNMPAKKHYLLSFVMSNNYKISLDRINLNKCFQYYYSSDISKTLGSILNLKEQKRVKNLYNNNSFADKANFLEGLLVAYYFTCPKLTSSLLQDENENWQPLFK